VSEDDDDDDDDNSRERSSTATTALQSLNHLMSSAKDDVERRIRGAMTRTVDALAVCVRRLTGGVTTPCPVPVPWHDVRTPFLLPVRLYPVDASRYLGMWLDLTTTHRQTWLFSSTSTYHSTDLLTARGVAHLVVHGTNDSTSYETILPVPLETSGGVLSTVDMVVQRRDGPRRLLDDDNDDDDYASAAMALCLSVCLSQVGVVSIRLNESSWFLA